MKPDVCIFLFFAVVQLMWSLAGYDVDDSYNVGDVHIRVVVDIGRVSVGVPTAADASAAEINVMTRAAIQFCNLFAVFIIVKRYNEI